MKYAQSSVVVVMFVTFVITPLHAHAIVSTLPFTDSFESSFTNWSEHGAWVDATNNHSGEKSAEIKNTTGSELRKDISTSGYDSIVLSYWYRILGGFSSADHLKVQWSIDGTTWTTLADYVSTPLTHVWLYASHNLPAETANASGFSFRFLAEDLEGDDQFRLDDASLTGVAIPTTPTTSTLRVVKQVIGGTATSSDFIIHVKTAGTVVDVAGSPQAGSNTGTDYSLSLGTYMVSEDTNPDYTADFTACGSTGSVILGLDSITCTVTNTYHGTPSVDVCSNIDGNQDTVPEGMTESAGVCTATPPPPTSAVEERHSGGGGCAAGFVFNPVTLKCDPKGAVLGASTGQVLGASCGLYMDQHLRKGNPKNNPIQVIKLQAFLNKHGFGGTVPTGIFDDRTVAAVNAFQNKYGDQILKPWGLTGPTGLVYLTTIRQINLLECPDLSIPVPTLVPWGS